MFQQEHASASLSSATSFDLTRDASQADPKTGKLAPGQINNSKDLDVEPKKEEQSFFGSFFSAAKGQPKKKGPQPMEAVCVS